MLFFLRNYLDLLDIKIKSKKQGNAINLAIKSQNFEIIDLILNHKDILPSDSYILNYVVSYFEKDPKENAKFLVKLILDKGMDPNLLREKFLKKEQLNKKE